MSKMQVNMKAPDFTLSDVHNTPVTLSDFQNKKNVILVFNRGFF